MCRRGRRRRPAVGAPSPGGAALGYCCARLPRSAAPPTCRRLQAGSLQGLLPPPLRRSVPPLPAHLGPLAFEHLVRHGRLPRAPRILVPDVKWVRKKSLEAHAAAVHERAACALPPMPSCSRLLFSLLFSPSSQSALLLAAAKQAGKRVLPCTQPLPCRWPSRRPPQGPRRAWPPSWRGPRAACSPCTPLPGLRCSGWSRCWAPRARRCQGSFVCLYTNCVVRAARGPPARPPRLAPALPCAPARPMGPAYGARLPCPAPTQRLHSR